MFPIVYTVNTVRINLLHTQVLGERFKETQHLIQKDFDIYKSRQEQIEIIEKRKTFHKPMKKCKKKKENEDNLNIHNYKTEEQKPIKRKFERDDIPDVSEEQDRDNQGTPRKQT
jgi:hypothetical protein